jgi:CheY-like chemotaxis protein
VTDLHHNSPAGSGAASAFAEMGTKVRGRRASVVKATALVVDDDEAIRQLAGLILRRAGYVVHTAAGAFEGLWKLRRQPVDVLITDIQMPGSDGCELARRAWQLWPHLPILFVSGSADGADFLSAVEDGPWAALGKPFSSAALMERVEVLRTRGREWVRPTSFVSSRLSQHR